MNTEVPRHDEGSPSSVEQVALEDSAGFRLSRLVRVRRERWAGQLGTLGLTPPQAAILRATRDHCGQALRALARTLNTDAMSVKRCVDELENRGWLVTTTREDDRRVRVVDLTARGEELMGRLDELAFAQERNLRDHLSCAHYESLIAAIAVLERAEGIGHDEGSTEQEPEQEPEQEEQS
ncbi:MAG: winged helix-turn-helix transcriptional regulator [Acidobacteria bacterium]|nr:winged helix-turn-helix transcriptional regulator [Acidobacteriota bacterium]